MADKTRYTFLEFLKEYSVRIPLIQRDYVQGAEHEDVKKLEKRQEFIKLLMNALKLGKVYHVDFIYGSPIQNQTSHSSTLFFIPLDGQQRLTTLFLLHWLLTIKSSINNQEKSELLKILKGFSYETRLSSASFCSKLTETLLLNIPTGTVRDTISDLPWYSSDWDFDPTINNMISMLEAMNTLLEEEYSADIDTMLTNAMVPQTSITFDLLNMTKYSLTDGLYIKMNARGKELTDFEHWKALFIQLLENEQISPTYKSIFVNKIEHEWANLFWEYVKEDNVQYPVIDNCFMHYFHYITELLYYAFSYPITKDKKDYNETFEQIKTVYAVPSNLDILFCSLDLFSIIGTKNSSFFQDLFVIKKDNIDDVRIKLFSDGNTNLFQRCIMPQENESFDIYEKILLYSIIRFFTHYGTNTAIVTQELIEYVRGIRNYLLNINQFVLANVNVVSNLRINEMESYNTFIENMITHLAPNQTQIVINTDKKLINWLEDLSFCRGNIDAFKDILQTYDSNRIYDAISGFNIAIDIDKVRLLIAAGYKGLGIGWCSYGYRRFFGRKGRWHVLFARDSKNIGIALASFINSKCTIDEFLANHIPTMHTFIYYALKYPEFVKASIYWKNEEDPSYYFTFKGNFDDFDIICLKSFSKSPLLAYHTEPFASAVLRKLLFEMPSVFGNGKLRNCNIYSEKASLVYSQDQYGNSPLSLKMTNKKWKITTSYKISDEIRKKYCIENDELSECNGLDLIQVACDFIKDIINN